MSDWLCFGTMGFFVLLFAMMLISHERTGSELRSHIRPTPLEDENDQRWQDFMEVADRGGWSDDPEKQQHFDEIASDLDDDGR